MNAWDKRDKESAKAYQAFCDYRDMGAVRSLRSLHEQYIKQASNKRLAKPPTQKESTIFTWSARNDWQKRVEAWDNHLSLAQTSSQENAVQNLLDAELRDYRLQLDKWTDAYRRTPLHETQHRTIAEDGSTIEFVKLNHDDLHRMAKWRDEIAKQGRRALGLPDRVTEKHIDHTSKGEKIDSLTEDGKLERVAALLDAARVRRTNDTSR